MRLVECKSILSRGGAVRRSAHRSGVMSWDRGDGLLVSCGPHSSKMRSMMVVMEDLEADDWHETESFFRMVGVTYRGGPNGPITWTKRETVPQPTVEQCQTGEGRVWNTLWCTSEEGYTGWIGEVDGGPVVWTGSTWVFLEKRGPLPPPTVSAWDHLREG